MGKTIAYGNKRPWQGIFWGHKKCSKLIFLTIAFKSWVFQKLDHCRMFKDLASGHKKAKKSSFIFQLKHFFSLKLLSKTQNLWSVSSKVLFSWKALTRPSFFSTLVETQLSFKTKQNLLFPHPVNLLPVLDVHDYDSCWHFRD